VHSRLPHRMFAVVRVARPPLLHGQQLFDMQFREVHLVHRWWAIAKVWQRARHAAVPLQRQGHGRILVLNQSSIWLRLR